MKYQELSEVMTLTADEMCQQIGGNCDDARQRLIAVHEMLQGVADASSHGLGTAESAIAVAPC